METPCIPVAHNENERRMAGTALRQIGSETCSGSRPQHLRRRQGCEMLTKVNAEKLESELEAMRSWCDLDAGRGSHQIVIRRKDGNWGAALRWA